jgi:UDP:flavonoid glycosyltransferase YjiC (YdhE family)
MTKYLFTTLATDDLGLQTRSLPIARELVARGHRVMFHCPAKAPRQLIAEAGFENLVSEFHEVSHGDQNPRCLDRRVVNELAPVQSKSDCPDVWNMDHAAATMGLLNEERVRARCQSFRELMKLCTPDVVVDFWNPCAVIAARSLQKPVITVIQTDAHPSSQGFIWWKTPPPNLPSPAPVVNRVLADYGLPCISKLADLSVGDLTLAVGMPETDPLPETAQVTYVGSVLWQTENARLPEWVNCLPTHRPLVWVYSGNPRYAPSSEGLDSIVVLQACVEALAEEDVLVILTTGHHPLPKELLPLPANFRHEQYLPGLLLADRSDVLVHHGGYGSCQTGLYAGKPAVILPTYSERESNARRLEALGAAVIVPVEIVRGKKRVRAEELRSAIRRVLADGSFGENARRLGERLRNYGGAFRAAQLIEAFSRARSGEKAC